MKIQKPYSILAACSALIGRHFLRTACISYEITVSQGASEPPQGLPKHKKASREALVGPGSPIVDVVCPVAGIGHLAACAPLWIVLPVVHLIYLETRNSLNTGTSNKCWGSVTFWYGSGSVEPYL
jgi:hypothetical protein